MPRLSAILLLVALGVVTAGCGAVGDGANASTEESLAASLRTVIDEDAPLVELRSVDCAGAKPTLACRVALGVGNTVVQVDYAVTLAADGCWTADAGRTVVLGAGSETNPLPSLPDASNLTGCRG